MNELEDKALRTFFKNEKKEIEDKGFSKRVMNNLPDRKNRLSTIWVTFCSIICIILFFLFNGIGALLFIIREGFNGAIKQGIGHIEPSTILIALVVIFSLGIRELYFANK